MLDENQLQPPLEGSPVEPTPMPEPPIPIEPPVDVVPTPEPVIPTVPPFEATPETVAPVEPMASATPDLGLQPTAPGLSSSADQPSFNFQKKKGKTGLIIGICAVLLVIAGAVIFYLISTSPKAIFKSVVNSFYQDFSSSISDTEENEFDINFLEDSILAKGNLAITSDMAELSMINDYMIDYTLGLDVKNEKMEAGISITESEKELINFLMNFKENAIYASLGTVFDKVINLDNISLEEIADIEDLKTYFEGTKTLSLTTDDIDYIVETMKDLINKSFDDVKFEKSSENTEIGDITVKARKLSLVLDESNTKIIGDTVLKGMIADDKLLEKIAMISGQDAADLKSLLEDALDEIDYDEFDDSSVLAIYTKGLTNKVIKISVLQDDEEMAYYSNYKDLTTIWIDNGMVIITLDETNDKGELVVTYNKKKVLTATINEFEGNVVDVDYTLFMDEDKITGSIKSSYKDSTWKGSMTANLSSDTNFKIAIDYEMIKKSATKYDIVFNLAISGDVQLSIKNTANLKTGVDIATLPITNVVNYSALTEADMTTMLTNLETALEGTALYSMLEAYSYGMSQSLLPSGGTTPTLNNDKSVWNVDDDYVTDATQCNSVYTDGTFYYNFDNDGEYTYAGTGMMVDGYCVFRVTNTY